MYILLRIHIHRKLLVAQAVFIKLIMLSFRKIVKHKFKILQQCIVQDFSCVFAHFGDTRCYRIKVAHCRPANLLKKSSIIGVFLQILQPGNICHHLILITKKL